MELVSLGLSLELQSTADIFFISVVGELDLLPYPVADLSFAMSDDGTHRGILGFEGTCSAQEGLWRASLWDDSRISLCMHRLSRIGVQSTGICQIATPTGMNH